MKGQASMEMLITVGMVLAFTVPVLFLMFTITSVGYENAGIAQAEASVRSLSDSINLVYGQGFSQGAGAKRVVLLNLPARTKEVSVRDGEVVLSVETSSGDFDASFPTFSEVEDAELVTSVNRRSGLVPVEVVADNGPDGILVRVSVLE